MLAQALHTTQSRAQLVEDYRLKDIARRYSEGQTLADIGTVYDITRERVRQLLLRTELTRKDRGHAVRLRQQRQQRQQSRDQQSIKRWGHTCAAHNALLQMRPSPVRRWAEQRRNAQDRHIPWELNLAQWWDIWQESGKWEARGRGHKRYVMSRREDVGPYAPGNVYIQLADVNNRERRGRVPTLPIGIRRAPTKTTGFIAMKSGRYLGTYRTIEIAQQAYAAGE